jgi:betaine-aldehyde dehydrogenase
MMRMLMWSPAKSRWQDCTAATRLYVHEDRQRDVTDALVEAFKQVKVGDPFEDGVVMGPMISRIQRERVQGFIERAKAQGARILTGGGIPVGMERGYYIEPTVITDVNQQSEIVQNEVFGPVVTIQTFKSDDEAVFYGNDVLYGLAASVFTKDVGRALKITADLEAGTVWVNDHIPITSETPHGGFKQSGFGKDMGVEAVHDYQITKHVMIAHG